MAKPSIVFLINSLTGGGAERVMARLITHSQARRSAFDLHLVLLDAEPDAYALPDWIRVHRLDSGKRLLPSVLGLWRLLRVLRPSLVLSFLTRSNLANLLTAKLLGHRVIISERANTSGHHDNGLSGRVSKFLIGSLYPRADGVIAVSAGIADDLAASFSVDRNRIRVIANPVDAEAIRKLGEQKQALPCEQPYIVGMGRFVRTKNFALLIEAFAASPLPDFRLVLIGRGPLEQELRDLVAARGIEARVHFVGFLDNPFPVIRAAAAYVLPSNGEGFPNGLVEAMAFGTPVIATDCRSGPSEILDDRPELMTRQLHLGRYGILVPADDKEAMTAALAMATAADAHESLSLRATAGAARYGLQAAIESYWEAVDGVLSHGPMGSR